jgi:CheY-like chemotaxis protein
VLVVEDSQTNQLLIKLLLEKMGLNVTAAEDSEKAIDKALNQHFDLIFMDIQIPGQNGREVTKILRRKGITTPIVALTAHAMKGDDEKCISAGCDEYLTKPIRRKKLFETICKYLPAESETTGDKTDYTEPQTGESETVESPCGQSSEDIIDWVSVAKICDDEDMIKAI